MNLGMFWRRWKLDSGTNWVLENTNHLVIQTSPRHLFFVSPCHYRHRALYIDANAYVLIDISEMQRILWRHAYQVTMSICNCAW